MKKTRANIMAATKQLIIKKGYSDMTTKDIAREAQVNEATVFRQFGTKKKLLFATLEEADWIPSVNNDSFKQFQWNITKDLRLIMENYFEQVTPEIVRFSLGLRSQEIYQETLPYIQKIPSAFTELIQDYLNKMKERGELKIGNPKESAEVIFSSMIGFAFLHAYSSEDQYKIDKDAFVSHAINCFVKGLN
ncbi:TetR/AcrR family transcriptional regulator [Enterococcus sp. AZ196]|uniref:TetR/AcrR family transcriptional regulator n=1 Tax=Enterococcus sp. AZ196 TaxID=2774659 RepID=UPI003D284B96